MNEEKRFYLTAAEWSDLMGMALERTDGEEQQEVLAECKCLLEQLLKISREPADKEFGMER